MSESASGAVNGDVTAGKSDKKKTAPAKKANIFARFALFVRQIIAELKKVVTPTRKEYTNYVITVIVFVLIMMAIVLVVDYLVGKGTGFLFG